MGALDAYFWGPLHPSVFQGNAPLNTAMVEIWLYVLYAVIAMYLLRGGSERLALGIVGVIYLATFAIVVMNPELNGWWNNGCVFAFAIYWWIGASFVSQYPLSSKWIAAIFIMWFVLTIFILKGSTHSLLVIECRKLCLAGLFGVLIHHLDYSEYRWYVLGRKIGCAGYSIYALHAPLLILLLVNGFSVWVALVLTLCIAFMVYYFFEKPLTEFGKNIADKEFIPYAVRI